VNKVIGKKLKQLRKQNDISLRKLAKKTGLSHSFISDIEHERCNPSIETLLLLAQAFEVRPEFFLNELVAKSEHNKERSQTTA